MKAKLNGRSGFTLIEIMLVVTIIAMLATIVGVSIVQHSKTSKEATAKLQIAEYGMALDAYHLDNGFFPITEQGLQALVAQPGNEPVPRKWHGPYLRVLVIREDPWGRQYMYACPPQQNPNPDMYDLYSVGPDGQPGTADDVVNWK